LQAYQPRVERLRFIALTVGALAASSPAAAADAQRRLADVEARYGGRLGVVAVDTESGKRIAYRAHERFAMCSTCKFLGAAAVLARVDGGRERLDRRIAYGRHDLVDFVPVTGAHVGEGGMTLGALCAAAIEYSDNTAANLIFTTLGGPAGVTRYVRSLDDAVTRLDRTEPTLNTAIPGDPRDTTTPASMETLMRRILLGDALHPASRARLEGWLVANTTGDARLRAGLPRGWVVGDKTGSGDRLATSDIAIVRPPGRAPILIAAYCTEMRPGTVRDAPLAEVGRIVGATFAT
jgi:beta-lactamase class A